MERRLKAQLWLRASFTKRFGNSVQTCLCAAKFWSALMQMPSPVRGYWNYSVDPKSQDPKASVLKVSFFWCYWNIKYHHSICFSSLGGIHPLCDANGYSTGMCTLSSTDILLWKSRMVSPSYYQVTETERLGKLCQGRSKTLVGTGS